VSYVEYELSVMLNSAQQQLKLWLDWKEKEPKVTALAALEFLKERGQDLPGGGREIVLKTGYRFLSKDQIFTVTSNDNREIIRVEQGQVRYTPQPQDQDLLQSLRQSYDNTQKEQQSQRRGQRL
jgi:hypothetical protein